MTKQRSQKKLRTFRHPVHQSVNAQEGVGDSLRMCGPKFIVFQVLVRNTVSILGILVINTVWLLHSSLELGMFFKRRYKTINESPP